MAKRPFRFVAVSAEQQNAVLIYADALQKAQRMIAGCEACNEDAELPFENILDRLTGSDPSAADHILEVSAKCVQCGGMITQKTLVAI